MIVTEESITDNKKIIELEDISKYNHDISECFIKLKSSRAYNKILESIKDNRKHIMYQKSIFEYIQMINDHNKILREIFSQKNYNEKKIISIINSSMSSIEKRLVFYENYSSCQLEIDDIQNFDEVLNIMTNHEKNYIPFNSQKFYSSFYHYGIVLFPIKKNIVRYISNPYKYYNIIYVPLNKDVYSFYTLEKIDDNKKFWKMDCRLEEFSNEFIGNIRGYMINLFKKIYFDIFHDNKYRPDYSKESQMAEFECEQLLENILLLCDPILFAKLLCTILKEQCLYYPTNDDKFNIRGDDAIQKRKFNNHKINMSDVIDIIKNLFDNIEDEEAISLYNSKCNK